MIPSYRTRDRPAMSNFTEFTLTPEGLIGTHFGEYDLVPHARQVCVVFTPQCAAKSVIYSRVTVNTTCGCLTGRVLFFYRSSDSLDEGVIIIRN